MSKYYKAEDVIRAIDDAFDSIPIEKTVEILKVRKTIRSLPTIEVSEDAISREDAVNALIAHFIPQTYTGEQVEQASKLAWKIMANAPSVVPTTEQSSEVGEWKWETNDICLNCGYSIPHLERIVGEIVLMDSKDWNFRPNCGARLKGANNEA